MPPKQFDALDTAWGTYNVLAPENVRCVICGGMIPAGKQAKYDTGQGYKMNVLGARQGYRHLRCFHPPQRKETNANAS